MEIPEKSPLHFLPTPISMTEEALQPPGEPNRVQQESAQKDTVNLTEKGREFKTAVQRARSLPEIREDRIVQVKRQLEAGTYRVKGHRVAVNLINETLQNNTVLKHIDTKA